MIGIVKDNGSVIASGNSARDYRTLIEAVKLIDRAAFIATILPDGPAMIAPYNQNNRTTVRGDFTRRISYKNGHLHGTNGNPLF